MKAIYVAATGELKSRASDDAPVADPLPVGWAVKIVPEPGRFDVWNPATLQFDPVAAPKVVDKTAFINRFTLPESRLFFGFQRTSAVVSQKQNVDALIGYLQTIGGTVNLEAPQVVQGVKFLETTTPAVLAAVLAAGRAAQILA